MIDYISFPLNANFFASGNENLKKSFGDCIIDTGSKVLRRFESKSSGAFNFIGFFALKLCNNSHNLIMKMTQKVTSQTKRKIY